MDFIAVSKLTRCLGSKPHASENTIPRNIVDFMPRMMITMALLAPFLYSTQVEDN